MLNHPARRTVLWTFALLLLASLSAHASQITIAWDPNTEADLAGYIVEYGPASAPFSVSVDVGNITTWTLTNAVEGTTYSFQVVAYNTSGLSSSPSASVSATAPSTVSVGGPTLTADRNALVFGVVQSVPPVSTPSQTIRLSQTGTGSVSWTASSNAPWLQVFPASGTGSDALTLSIVTSAVPASSASAAISIVSNASNTIAPITVALNVIPPPAASAPFGSFDTPQNDISGVTGSLAITGWALDDVGVTRVRVFRDPVAGETPGQLVYVGDGTFVEDARPDLAAAYSQYPQSHRAGWGYLALTDTLPAGGNGTFRFYAYADDVDGHTTLLGARTVTCTDATATLPFGTIDTPAPGETISGSNYVNYGWVLSPGTARADVPGGGTVTVLIDGVAAGAPSGWTARSDLTALFPATQYAGVGTALAAFAFDTTRLADGMHTIAWVVTDNQGNTSGIGSRFFRVFNAALSIAPAQAVSAVSSVSLSGEIAAARLDTSAVEARRGFSLDTEFQGYESDSAGLVTIQAEEVDRIELKTHDSTEGYLRAGVDLHPLPLGSQLDPATGVFTWQPAAGFVGPYDFVFVRRNRGSLVRQEVRIVLNPRGGTK